jgi:hypothetical protein
MRQNPDYATGLQDISAALIACGYTKLDKQAKALGVRRSTAAIAFRVLPKWLAPRKQLSRAFRLPAMGQRHYPIMVP